MGESVAVNHTNPHRKRFANASREDKYKRSRLYHQGQYRLLIQGRKVAGPVHLIGVVYSTKPEDVGAVKGERLWQVDLMWCEKTRVVGEYDLGVEVNEMEAIAWASLA